MFMMGYCSNSPLRCPHARSMQVLHQANSSCPDCGLSLIPSNNVFSGGRFEQRVLQVILATIAILLLVLVYVYYVTSM